MWKFFYQLPGHLIEYVSEYTFLISKNNNKQQKKQKHKQKNKNQKKQKKLKKKREYLRKID